MVLTTTDFQAVDPDNTASQLTFTVSDQTYGHVAFASAPGTTISSFTEADLETGNVLFVQDGTATNLATFKVSVSDGIATSAAATILAAVPTATIQVLTSNGFDFANDNWLAAMGSGQIQPVTSLATEITIVNSAQNMQFVIDGTNLTVDNEITPTDITAGTITAIHVLTNDATPEALFDATGILDAAQWYDAVVAKAGGNDVPFDTMTSNWSINFVGSDGSDVWSSGDANDFFHSNSATNPDVFDGQSGFDRAIYVHAPGPIDVDLASGTVAKYTDASMTTVGSTDTLHSVEMIFGTNYADHFDATGFAISLGSPNVGSWATTNQDGTFNEFEGRGGDDIIVGNGDTRISYLHATSGVTVNIASGTADGDASVGHDTFSGVNSVRGSYFDDTLIGSNNPTGAENFEGRGGNDTIDGGGGFDRAVYANEDHSIAVDLGGGIVTGGPNTGTDTLHSIEGIIGTEFSDTFDASSFTISSANAGDAGVNGSGVAFNEFEGLGGDDTITGNGNTRVSYYHATDGVTVTLGSGGSGTAQGTAPGDLAGIGTDTFVSGVSRVNGSEFNDTIIGNGGNNTLDGRGGDDTIDGGGGSDAIIGGSGNDHLTGGAGADKFIFQAVTGGNGMDHITDFDLANDFLQFDLSLFSDANAVISAASDDGSGHTVISADASNVVTLDTVSYSQFVTIDHSHILIV